MRRRRRRKYRTGKEMVGGKRRRRIRSLQMMQQSGVFCLHPLLFLTIVLPLCPSVVLGPLSLPHSLRQHPSPSSSSSPLTPRLWGLSWRFKLQLSSLRSELRHHQVRLCAENTPAAAGYHTRCRARVLFTCDSVWYRCDNQPLELRLDSSLQVLHLQYHLLRLWKRDVTKTAASDCSQGQRSPCQ